MTKLRAASTLAVLTLILAGCSSAPELSVAPSAQAGRLGVGDSIGRHLSRTDRAIAGADVRDRALASHPDE